MEERMKVSELILLSIVIIIFIFVNSQLESNLERNTTTRREIKKRKEKKVQFVLMMH